MPRSPAAMAQTATSEAAATCSEERGQRRVGKRLRVEFDAAVALPGCECARRLLIALPPGLALVADLARHLQERLAAVQLRPLLLAQGDFALPLAQRLSDVVRDDDVLTVREASAVDRHGGNGAFVACSIPSLASEAAAAPPQAPSPATEWRPVKRVRQERGGSANGSSRSVTVDGPELAAARASGAAADTKAGTAELPLVTSAEAARVARAALAARACGGGGGGDAAKAALAAAKAAALAEADALAGTSAESAPAAEVGEDVEGSGSATEEREAGEEGGAPRDSYRVFVGGLPWSCGEDMLRRDFSECGRITDLAILTERETGRSRGIAFITFEDEAGFQAALKYNGDMYGGRTLKVCKAESKGQRRGKGKCTSGKGRGKSNGKGRKEGRISKHDA